MTDSAAGETGEPTRTRGSIARRMLIAAAIWSIAVLVAAGWSLAALYQSETENRLDEELNASITTLTSAVDTDATGQISYNNTPLPNDERFNRTYSGWYWAFIDLNMQTKTYSSLVESASLFNTRPDIPAGLIATALAQRKDNSHGNSTGPLDAPLRIGVRAVTLPERANPILIYVGIDRTSANKAVGRFTLRLGIALAVLGLGLVVGVLVLIRYGLRPLHEIQDKLADVRSGRRDLLDGEYPGELSPVVREINTLISQNRKVVDRARTHVGNLAHALKTPLAVLMNEARGGDKLSELVRRQADAMSSNVQHYLKRAQAAAQAEVLGVRTDMREPIEGIARMLERLHRDKGLAITVDVDDRAVFRGERGDLDDLVGNLLENAAKWCKSRIKVKVSRLEDGVEVVVDDDGPGLAPELRAKALERGKRLDETAPGTGLGLAIVTELADIYGGRLHLEDSPMGGLRARLVLPAAPL